MKHHSLLILPFLILLTACDLFRPAEFAVTGTITDQFNQGVDSVKIFYAENEFVYSNTEGVFTIAELRNEVTLKPEKDHCTFNPDEMTVGFETDTLHFDAERQASETETLLLNWLKNLQLSNGLLESTDKSNIVSLYDNALAALVFVAYNELERAERIFDFFQKRMLGELKNGKGGYSQFRDRNGSPNMHKWLGDNAWLLIALNNYHAYAGNNKYGEMAMELDRWIRSLQDEKDGGIWGGYTAEGTRIHKITEGNIDAFNAVAGYDDFHSELLKWFEVFRWDSTAHSLVAWPGNARYLYALDVHAWSYAAFENFPVQTLHFADGFVTTVEATVTGELVTGFCFDMDKDVIWLEGTGEMVVAYNEAGMSNEAGFYLKELEKMLAESKYTEGLFGLPYASNPGTGYGGDPLWSGADTNPAISSTAWYLFGMRHFNPFKIEKNKIPDEAQFWNK